MGVNNPLAGQAGTCLSTVAAHAIAGLVLVKS